MMNWFRKIKEKKQKQYNVDLIACVKKADLEGIDEALAKGADPNCALEDVMDWKVREKDKILDRLIDHGTDVNKALLVAAEFDQRWVAAYLLRNGADLSFSGNLPIKVAITYGSLNVAECLIKRGVDINEYATYFLDKAVKSDRYYHLEFLIENGIDIFAADYKVLEKAALANQVDLMIDLLDKHEFTQEDMDKALAYACGNGHIEAVEFLITKGADVNSDNGYALERTISDARRSYDDFGYIDVDSYSPIVRLLLANGIDLYQDKDKWLKFARYCRFDEIKQIIEEQILREVEIEEIAQRVTQKLIAKQLKIEEVRNDD